MTTGNFDINAEEGSTLELEFEYTDPEYVPISVSSSNIRLIVKKSSIKTNDFMFQINSNGSITEGTIPFPDTNSYYGTIVKGTTGKFTITVTSDVMEILSPGTYFYNLSLISNNRVDGLCKGRFTVESKVK